MVLGLEILMLLIPAFFNPIYLVFTLNPLTVLALYLSPLTGLLMGVLDLLEEVGRVVG